MCERLLPPGTVMYVQCGFLYLILTDCCFRDLTQYEADILVHPRLCFVCLSGNQVIFFMQCLINNFFQLNFSVKIVYFQASLTNCSACHCVAYCSEKCRYIHTINIK
jgi:hypothetical protein